jgi:hypothetical protein
VSRPVHLALFYDAQLDIGTMGALSLAAESVQSPTPLTYTASELPKSGLYVDLLPKLNSKTVRLVNNGRLVNQIAALERRTSRQRLDRPSAARPRRFG